MNHLGLSHLANSSTRRLILVSMRVKCYTGFDGHSMSAELFILNTFGHNPLGIRISSLRRFFPLTHVTSLGGERDT